MSGSRRPSAIGRRAYEFTLNSDGGDCDDPILWFIPCFHLARVNSELKAPHRGAGCGGNKSGGGGFFAPPPTHKQVAFSHTPSVYQHQQWNATHAPPPLN